MNAKGMLYLLEDEILVDDIEVSTRLKNVLRRKGIVILSQLE